MTAFKKLTAYSDAKCKWVSTTYPHDEENAQLKDENAKLREENKRLRTVAVRYYTELMRSDDVLGQIMARKKLQELGIEA